ncbi:hypothetical protein KI387_000438, partial [Taxus chinensis]
IIILPCAIDSVLSWAGVSVAIYFSLYFNTAAACAPLYLTWPVEQYSTNRRGCTSMNTNVLPNLHHIRQKLEEMKYLNNNGSVKDHEKPGVGNPFPPSFDNNNIQNKCNSSTPLLQQGSAPSHMSVDDAADPLEIVESSQQVDLREFLEQLGVIEGPSTTRNGKNHLCPSASDTISDPLHSCQLDHSSKLASFDETLWDPIGVPLQDFIENSYLLQNQSNQSQIQEQVEDHSFSESILDQSFSGSIWDCQEVRQHEQKNNSHYYESYESSPSTIHNLVHPT